MGRINDFLKRYTLVLHVCLLLIAALFLSIQITAPLVDYDEATYAKIAVDTLASGDVSTFMLSGHHWFEKPPLYLWEVFGFIKVLGVHEYVFRIPSIIASLVCLSLVYLIILELTDNVIAASSTLLILLTAAPFYTFAVQARMDSSVIANRPEYSPRCSPAG